MARLI